MASQKYRVILPDFMASQKYEVIPKFHGISKIKIFHGLSKIQCDCKNFILLASKKYNLISTFHGFSKVQCDFHISWPLKNKAIAKFHGFS